MKFCNILRAIVRPLVEVQVYDDALQVQILGSSGPGLLVSDARPMYGCPPRATHSQIGGLHVAYWGRDTLVHPAPEAS
jgi:hypothetical protein